MDLTYLLSFSPLRPEDVLAVLLQRADVAPRLGEYVEAVFRTVLLLPPLVGHEEDRP